jgi:hypothetical protein
MFQRKKGYSRNQVGLELVEIDVQRAIKSQRSSDGGNNLSDQPVQVRKTGGGDVEVLLANVVNGFVVNLYQSQTKYDDEKLKHTMKEQSECSKVVWVVRTEL